MKQNIIAIVYDFDGTLTPYSMQDYTLLPELGVTKTGRFWSDLNRESRMNGEEKDLAWMRKIKELAHQTAGRVRLSPKFFSKKAGNIEYFQGVRDYFGRINRFVRRRSRGKIQIRHYIVSSGLKEILDYVSIRKYFYNVFGSEYHYDPATGLPDFPKVVITDTIKTQYIFRINKGKEKMWQSINTHMPEPERPIPFQNIIYVGDGLTDVPAMNVTRKNGGHPIAVYDPKSRKGRTTCEGLIRAGRVEFIAPADYRKGRRLSTIVELILDSIIQRQIF